MRRLRGGWAALLLLSLCADPPPASASERASITSVLRLEPGASCLRQGPLSAQIERWLGGSGVDAGVGLEVTGDAKFSRFVTIRVLRAGSELSERRFEPGPFGCDDLHAAVAMAAALALRAQDDASARADGRVQSFAAERVGDVARFQVTIAALGGAGALPGAAWGGSLDFAWVVSRLWSAHLTTLALYSPARSLAQAGTFDTSAAWGRLQLCSAIARTARFRLATCAGPEAGVIWASGRDYAPSLHAASPRLGVGADLIARLGIADHWAIQMGIGVTVPLSRTRFAARDEAGMLVASERLSLLGVLATLGLSFEF